MTKKNYFDVIKVYLNLWMSHIGICKLQWQCFLNELITIRVNNTKVTIRVNIAKWFERFSSIRAQFKMKGSIIITINVFCYTVILHIAGIDR